MLKINDLSKTYTGDVKALQDINLSIPKGMFGLLGPNGAGKSTLMRTLATLQLPDSGNIKLGDLDFIKHPLEARRKVGYLPQDMGVYPRVSAYEMLEYLAGLKGISSHHRKEQIQTRLEQVNLVDVAHRRLDTYSGGMRQRFGIAAAFLGSPELVIVDEPTAGLDPSERRRFQFLLADAAQNCVLILSSHIVEDIAGLCTDMALMKKGQIIRTGSPINLIDTIAGKVWQKPIRFSDIQELQQQQHVLSWRPHQGELMVRVLADENPGDEFELGIADLEDLYSSEIRAHVLG